MSETYSRVGSISIKKETTENVAVTPDTFIPFNDEGITDDFSYSPSMPVSGNRAMNLRAIKNRIPAPNGAINLNVEPKTFGHFLNAIFGGLTSGVYFPISSASGDFTVGETVTGGTSGETANVDYVSEDFLLVSSISGAFTIGETITGGSSGETATLGTYNSTVYGHAANVPADLSDTYSLQKNYADRAIRYMGVKFHNLDALGQSDNIVTAGVQMMARSMFRHAKVTAVVTSGAGAKSIAVDQAQGLVAGDTIKVWRKGTGFLDFSAASTKTHTIDTVDAANKEIDITNLETSLAVGDLIVLAPQTASYTVTDEFAWIGGASAKLGSDVDNLSSECLEDFTMVVTNELEERHCASGNDFADRFPSKLLQKSLQGNGSFTLANESEEFIRHARLNTEQAIEISLSGGEIESTDINYQLKMRFAEVQFDAYQLSLAQDDIINEEVPFTSFYDSDEGYSIEVLLVNDIASY